MARARSPTVVERAAAFAGEAHKGQKRKWTGEAYVTHPMRVAKNVAAAGGDEAQVAAAWLHDTVEDTPVTVAGIRAVFGPDVAKLVEELTNVYTAEAFPDLNRAERKAREVQRLSSISKRAKLIKLFDVMDNMPSVCANAPGGFARVYVPEAQAVLAAITS